MPLPRIVRRAAVWSIAIIAGLALLLFLIFDVLRLGSVTVPPAEPVVPIALEQNWRQGWGYDGRDWYHHADQGTKILPYSWFMALEQPDITVFLTPNKVSDAKYLERFGFLSSEHHDDYNRDGLPIGFAINENFQEPYATVSPDGDQAKDKFQKPAYKSVGLTCAACHTGQWNVDGKGIRIEGGPAMVNLALFQDAVGRALAYTELFPTRFHRFAQCVLGDGYQDQEKVDQLREELHVLVANGKADRTYVKKKGLYNLAGGFGRTDALGLIANRAFQDFKNTENLAVADAPVSFPAIWDAPWLDWVQYNGSIRLPMMRNIGEVLGVGGIVNLDEKHGRLFASTVNVDNLHRMEAFIAGSKPFAGLSSPKWPQHIFGNLDKGRLEEGRRLYNMYCIKCHKTTEQLQATYDKRDEQFWHVPDCDIADRYPGQGIFIRLQLENLDLIGTDPAQALNLYRRVVHTDRNQLISAGEALANATKAIRDQKYDALHLSDEDRLNYDGYRKEIQSQSPPNEPDDNQGFIATLGYKARPLNGVWATAPYLHNGSIPNLYQLLSPQAERSRRFFVGSRRFDPKNVGVVADDGVSGFELDTSLPGNLNIGHEFRMFTLEELERWRHGAPRTNEHRAATVERWAAVLDTSKEDFKAVSSAQREHLVNEMTKTALSGQSPFKAAHVPGVIGPQLSSDERYQIIEYLKSL